MDRAPGLQDPSVRFERGDWRRWTLESCAVRAEDLRDGVGRRSWLGFGAACMRRRWECWRGFVGGGETGVPIIGLNMFLNPGDIMKNALDRQRRVACLDLDLASRPSSSEGVSEWSETALRLMILYVCVCVCFLTPLAFRTAHLLLALPPSCPLYVP